jgi:hypothetical protein
MRNAMWVGCFAVVVFSFGQAGLMARRYRERREATSSDSTQLTSSFSSMKSR